MKRRSWMTGVTVLGFLTFTGAGLGELKEVEIKTGFYTGNDYRSLPPSCRSAYTTGVIDGLLLSPLFKASREELSWLETCVVGMTVQQTSAILDKYIEENPAKWHWGANILLKNALRSACPREGPS